MVSRENGTGSVGEPGQKDVLMFEVGDVQADEYGAVNLAATLQPVSAAHINENRVAPGLVASGVDGVTADGATTGENGTDQVDGDESMADDTADNATVTGNQDTQNGALHDSTLMPPPAAPASLLYTIKPSDPSRHLRKGRDDHYHSCRLVLCTVILFRAGQAKEARTLGQFTIDLIGSARWSENLAMYTNAGPDEDEMATLSDNLAHALWMLENFDTVQAGFLRLLIPFLIQFQY